ncbi:hypothetical protein P3S67_027732 [Capsicum chacoense]
MEGYAAQALEQYNKENDTTYEVDQILRRGIYSIHYITLTVKNGVEEYFQVKAVQRLGIPIVRPKVKGSSDI